MKIEPKISFIGSMSDPMIPAPQIVRTTYTVKLVDFETVSEMHRTKHPAALKFHQFNLVEREFGLKLAKEAAECLGGVVDKDWGTDNGEFFAEISVEGE